MTIYRHGRRPLHDYLRHHARTTPRKPAIVWYGRRISYAELDDLSDRFAQCLRERGIGQGDVIVLFMHNCPQFHVAQFGAQKLGVIVSPCNPASKAWELGHQVLEVDAAAIVCGDELLDVVQESSLVRRVEHVFAVDYGAMLPQVIAIDVPDSVRMPGEPAPPRPAFATDFDTCVSDADPWREDVAIDLDDVALMAYTSGSTGLPKGAMLSYEAALYKAAVSADGFGVGADEVILSETAMHHIAGMVTGLVLPVYTGATVVLLQRFDPLAVLQAIECCKVSWWYTMAPSLPVVMGCDEAASFELRSLRQTVATSFGLQLTEALADQWRAFTRTACVVYEAGYGLSETHTCDTIMPREAIRWGTNGKPVAGVELRIVDPDSGLERPTGEHGEILLRSPVRFKGYWRRPEATQEALLDGWTRTGDIGVVDELGYLTFLGRRKEMLKVWSYTVFPEEVEAILATHPDVRQVAVVGAPDPNCGEALHAYVVLHDACATAAHRDGAHETEARLIRWCMAHMAHYKVPRTVVLRHHLPATCTGKLLRRMLKSPAASAPASLRYAYR
ncbi:MAG: AMP-binding protein [Pseudomonadota bacterium]